MRRRCERERLVGKVGWEDAGQRADRQVLIDDDRDERNLSAVGVVGPTPEQRVGVADDGKGIGELVRQVAHRDPKKDRLVFLAQPGVTPPALTPKLFKQLFALGHHSIVTPRDGQWIPAPGRCAAWRGRRAVYRSLPPKNRQGVLAEIEGTSARAP